MPLNMDQDSFNLAPALLLSVCVSRAIPILAWASASNSIRGGLDETKSQLHDTIIF